jgi:hypothetical protein
LNPDVGNGAFVVLAVADSIVCHPRSFLATYDLRFRTILWLVSHSTSF